jgi:beta-1,4-mannosyltransferase
VPLTYRVVQVSRVRLNPYVRLLQTALLEAGVPCSTAEELGPLHSPFPAQNAGWSTELPGVANILHLHWLELLYSAPTRGRAIRRLAAVLVGLAWVKARGGKIVYTVHNLHPHEQDAPALNRVANIALSALVDAWHVHDEEAKMGAARVYGRPDRIYVVPHGSYVGAYPNDCTREESRARLGLAEHAVIYLCLGQIRRYKGIEDLIVAFKQLSTNGGDCQLVLAGHVHDPVYATSLSELTQGQDGIHTWFHYVDDAELQYFMNACDVCVLPYRDITTSGAAILAFSFGKPVVAPALGGFPELVADGRGILYDPKTGDGLLRALQQVRSGDMVTAGQKALAWAKEHEWRVLAPRFMRIYESVLGNNPANPANPAKNAGRSSGNAGRSPANRAGRTASAGRGGRPERGCRSDSGNAGRSTGPSRLA